MGNGSTNILMSSLRAIRLCIHIFYGMLWALFYPSLKKTRQQKILKTWSKQLLDILNIGLQIEGQQSTRGEGGCLIVANHVSWVDIFVLNAIHPSRFIAKSEVRDWPIIGWLSQRVGTIFIDRELRQKASEISLRVSLLLEHGVSIGLFPEGTTTDGKQVGHFHSALMQPAIDAGVRLYPIAIRYQNESGETSIAAAFIGDTTLVQSIWRILRSPHLNALVVFTPAMLTVSENRRVLARAAQNVIAQALQTIGTTQQEQAAAQHTTFDGHAILSPQSSYSLLVDHPHE